MADTPAPQRRPVPRPSAPTAPTGTSGTSGAGTGDDETADVLTRLGVIGTTGTLVELMGITILEVSPEGAVGTMRVAGNTQPHGLLHGGASVVLAETLGSVAAMLAAGPGRTAVGIEVNATHHRAVRPADDAEVVTGTAQVLHAGRTSASYEIVITDALGRRVCTSRLTCQLRDAPPR